MRVLILLMYLIYLVGYVYSTYDFTLIMTFLAFNIKLNHIIDAGRN